MILLKCGLSPTCYTRFDFVVFVDMLHYDKEFKLHEYEFVLTFYTMVYSFAGQFHASSLLGYINRTDQSVVIKYNCLGVFLNMK